MFQLNPYLQDILAEEHRSRLRRIDFRMQDRALNSRAARRNRTGER
jgi:hypothetical protein